MHEQRGHDRQRQRQADLGAGALAGLGGQRDLAAELADRDAHGVHADAAAGDVARGVGGREARVEEQLGGAREVDGLGLADQAAGAGLLGHLLGVDAAAVVLDGDDHVAAGVAGLDLQLAGLGLARGGALGRRLEAVVERVADQVHERVAERVHDRAVELGVLADELELDLLGELDAEVAHEPREAQQHGLDGDHADLHDHRLQGVRGPRQALDGLGQAGDVGVGGQHLDLGAVEDELAHRVHQLVQPLGVDAHGRGAVAARVALGAGDGRRDHRGVRLAVDGRVGHGLDGLRVGDLRDGRGDLHQLGVGAVGDQPGDDLVALEALDVVRRGDAGQRLAERGQRGEHHVGAHGRHLDVLVERRVDLDDATALGHLAEVRPAPRTSSRRFRPLRRRRRG